MVAHEDPTSFSLHRSGVFTAITTRAAYDAQLDADLDVWRRLHCVVDVDEVRFM